MLPDPDETGISDEEEVVGEAVAALVEDAAIDPGSDPGPFAPTDAPDFSSDPPHPPSDSAADLTGPDATAPADSPDTPAAAPVVPLPPPYVPRPKVPIRPERVATPDGEPTWSTGGVVIERTAGRAFFVTIHPPQSEPTEQRIYVHAHAFEHLVTLAEGQSFDAGRLWRALCDIPIDRPLPSRRLEEELRALLTTFANDFRG